MVKRDSAMREKQVSLSLHCVPVWPKYGMLLTLCPLTHTLSHILFQQKMTQLHEASNTSLGFKIGLWLLLFQRILTREL